MRFDFLNCLGMAHVCNRRTDKQTEPLLAIARSNDHKSLPGSCYLPRLLLVGY